MYLRICVDMCMCVLCSGLECDHYSLWYWLSFIFSTKQNISSLCFHFVSQFQVKIASQCVDSARPTTSGSRRFKIWQPLVPEDAGKEEKISNILFFGTSIRPCARNETDADALRKDDDLRQLLEIQDAIEHDHYLKENMKKKNFNLKDMHFNLKKDSTTFD